MQLKREIERLLEQGHLKEYVKVREPRREREMVRERTHKRITDTPQEGVRG